MTSELSHRLKFYRAQHHLEELHAKISAWSKNHSYTTRLEPDDSRPGVLALKATAESIPNEQLTPLIGDVIQNLRSTLDHLVFALSVRHSGPLTQDQAKVVKFPIHWDDGRQPPVGERFRNTHASSLKFVSPDVRTAIEMLQPYHVERETGGKLDHTDSFLWRLHELSNIDKHQAIPLVGVLPTKFEFRSAFDGEFTWFANAMVETDTPIAFVRIPPDSRHRDVNVDLTATMEIGFRDPPAAGNPVIPLLADICGWVAYGVIEPLERFL